VRVVAGKRLIVAVKVKMEDCDLPNGDAAAKGLFSCDFSADTTTIERRYPVKSIAPGLFRSAITALLVILITT
jgi:hypothetical protein